MDELRDYRFYKSDLNSPHTAEAEEYKFGNKWQFLTTFFSGNMNKPKVEEIRKINLELGHRTSQRQQSQPTSNSEENLLQKLERLKSRI